MKEQYGVQMLRAVAALAVVFHHSLEESNGAATAFSPDWLTTFGASGVDIFFVISGFIMLYTSFPTARPPISPGSFLFRRATRIYPFYWVCCLGMLGIVFIGFLRHHRLTSPEIALSLALLPSPHLIVTVSWTLIYEVYFYLIFAITLVFRSALASAGVTTAVIAILWLVGRMLDAGVIQAFLTDPIPFEFVAGLWLAIAFTREAVARRRWVVSYAWAILGFGLLALAPVYVSHATTAGLAGWPRVLAWGLPSTLIVAAFLSIAPPRNAFQRLLVFLGDASYALYLTHVFVMIGYALILKIKSISQAPQIVIVFMIFLLAVAVGVAAHLIVEKPLSRTVRRWTGHGRVVSERPVPL
jgi:exopolysaccharide production protein ExoZ